jgi:hypothetical protein
VTNVEPVELPAEPLVRFRVCCRGDLLLDDGHAPAENLPLDVKQQKRLVPIVGAGDEDSADRPDVARTQQPLAPCLSATSRTRSPTSYGVVSGFVILPRGPLIVATVVSSWVSGFTSCVPLRISLPLRIISCQRPKKRRRIAHMARTLEPRRAQDLSALARALGARGGKARAKNLSAKERSEGARKASLARWSKAKRGE